MAIELVSNIQPKNNADFYMVDSEYVKGGCHQAETYDDMLAISETRLKDGTLCLVSQPTKSLYVYNLASNTWSLYSAGGGGDVWTCIGDNETIKITQNVDDWTQTITAINNIRTYDSYEVLPTTDVENNTVVYCKADCTLVSGAIKKRGFYYYDEVNTAWTELVSASSDGLLYASTPEEMTSLAVEENLDKLVMYIGDTTTTIEPYYEKNVVYRLHWDAITTEQASIIQAIPFYYDFKTMKEALINEDETMYIECRYSGSGNNDSWSGRITGSTSYAYPGFIQIDPSNYGIIFYGINDDIRPFNRDDYIVCKYTYAKRKNYSWQPLNVETISNFNIVAKDPVYYAQRVITYNGANDNANNLISGHRYVYTTTPVFELNGASSYITVDKDLYIKNSKYLGYATRYAYIKSDDSFDVYYGFNVKIGHITTEEAKAMGFEWEDGLPIGVNNGFNVNYYYPLYGTEWYWKDLDADAHTHTNLETLDKLTESDDGKLLFDGQEIVGGSSEHIELTQAEYDALTEEEKMNGAIYFITDAIGGGGGDDSSHVEITQAEYDVLSDEEKTNGTEYRTYDTGHIYKLGVEYGKDASADDIVSFAKPSQLGLDDTSCTVVDLINAMFLEQRKDYSKRLIGIFPYVKNESNITDLPTDISSKGQVEICTSGWDMASAKFTDTANCIEYIGRTIVASGAVNSITWKKVATTITSLSQLGLTAPTTVGEVFMAMPEKSMLMLNCESFDESSGNTPTVTDIPKEFGVLTIEKFNYGRFRIEYSNSLGGSATDVKKWIGSLKGTDGTGLTWKELTGSAKIYTTMAQLGLDGATATVQDVIDAISVGEIAMLRSDAFNNNNWQTQCNGIQWGYLKIEKTMNGLSNIELQEVITPNRRYFGTQSSGKFVGWVRVPTNIIYNSIAELNKAKGTSISLVNGEDNTQKIVDALSVGEQFVSFYHNGSTQNRFGIDVSYGSLINEIRIVKCLDADLTSNYAIATAFMNTGCVMSRIYYKTYSTDWCVNGTITSLSQLGLTADATLDDVIGKLGAGQNATLSTSGFTNYKTLFPYSEEQDAFASVRIEKSFDASRTIVTWIRKDASKLAYGGLNSSNKVAWWNEYALKSYVDSKTGGINVAQTNITINTNWATQEARADCPTNKYVVKNGICYLSATFTTLADKNYTLVADLATGLPKPAIGCFANVASGSNKNALVYIHNDGTLKGSSLSTSTLYNVSLTYPVAE